MEGPNLKNAYKYRISTCKEYFKYTNIRKTTAVLRCTNIYVVIDLLQINVYGY